MRKLYNEYFHIPKHGKIRDKVFSAKIALSFCIILFLISTSGITAYAYFSSAVNVNVASVFAAEYNLVFTITDITDELNSEVNPVGGVYSLDAGTYSVSIRREETERNAKTGFCKVYINQTEYHTAQIGTDVNTDTGKRETITFTIVVPVSAYASVSFEAHWGTSSNYRYVSDKLENEYYIENKDVITVADSSGTIDRTPEVESSEQIVTIQEGYTLSDIAEKYKTTVDKILAYNNIADSNMIQIGDEIKIPPEDYEIPEPEPVTEETPDPTEEPSTDADPSGSETDDPDFDSGSDEHTASEDGSETSEQP